MMTHARWVLAVFVLLAASAMAQNRVSREDLQNRAYQRWNLQYEPYEYPTGGYESGGYSTGGYRWKADYVGGYRHRKYMTGGYDARLGSRTARPYVGNPFVEDPPYRPGPHSQGGREYIQPPETGRKLRPNFWGWQQLRKTPPSGTTEDTRRSGD